MLPPLILVLLSVFLNGTFYNNSSAQYYCTAYFSFERNFSLFAGFGFLFLAGGQFLAVKKACRKDMSRMSCIVSLFVMLLFYSLSAYFFFLSISLKCPL